MCAPHQALRHFKNGVLKCALAVPVPDCTERTNLRKFGTGDMFFRTKWAYWLRDTIPGASEVVEIDGGRLFFPDERAAELTAALRRHWAAHP